jgi:hypothetical protein
MKKLLIASVCFLALTQNSLAQCELPTQLPYVETMETAPVSEVPECMSTSWGSFSSTEVFETIEGPVEGFQGKLLAYDTATDSNPATVTASLTTPLVSLQQGMAYTVYFLYRNSDPNLTISNVSVDLSGSNVSIGSIENITGAVPTNFISAQFTPPADGDYNIVIRVTSLGNQGLFYLDHIMVQEVGVMGVDDNALTGLSLYPNPVNDILTVNYKNEIESVEVYGSTGQLVMAEKPNTLEANINVSGLSSGVYFLNITSEGHTKRTKILKE